MRMEKRIISVWFPRLPSERVLRARPLAAPFALTETRNNTQSLYCLNALAEAQGLLKGMGLGDARVLCPDLHTVPANPPAEVRFLQTLARWGGQYCPWVGTDPDGLVLDASGSTHLLGGDRAMLDDMAGRLARAGLTHKTALAGTRGAAWAMARFGRGGVLNGPPLTALGPLPVAALRLDPATGTGLERLGIKTIADLAALPRPSVTRRFGAGLLLRLDQALGDQPEPVSPPPLHPIFAVRMTFPEPIGLQSDISAGLARLLARLCDTLSARECGARRLQLGAQRVDQASQMVEVRLARPMRDPIRIAALFAAGIETLDPGFGIDMLRLEATETAPLALRQTSRHAANNPDGLADLVSRLGTRIGLENITRHLPADSHIPEHSFTATPAAYCDPPAGGWFAPAPRPLLIFPPEPIAATGPQPPERFRWRRMRFRTARATGPERIAPEWWLDDPAWRSGLRDYWRICTVEGRRLWLFFTPQNPGWFVQGEFP